MILTITLCSRVSSSLSTRIDRSQLVSSSENEILNAHFPTAWVPDIDPLRINVRILWWSLRNMDVFTTSPGLFDLCLAVESPYHFHGQYCSVFFKEEHPTISKTESRVMNKSRVVQIKGDGNTYTLPRVGFCIPSSCSPLDFRSAVAKMIAHSIDDLKNYSENSQQTSYNNSHPNLVVIADENYCYTKEKIAESTAKFDELTIAFM